MADDKHTTASPEIRRDGEINAAEEHVELAYDDLKKDHKNYERVDAEVAKYASAIAIDISPEENSRLKRLVDKRVLSIMVFA